MDFTLTNEPRVLYQKVSGHSYGTIRTNSMGLILSGSLSSITSIRRPFASSHFVSLVLK